MLYTCHTFLQFTLNSRGQVKNPQWWGGTMSNVAEIQVQQQTNRKIISKC